MKNRVVSSNINIIDIKIRFADYFSFPFYILRHPFDGFYIMKHSNKGRRSFVLINLVLLWLAMSSRILYTSYIISNTNIEQYNGLTVASGIGLAFVLWCTANWAVTTLMDGEGRMRDIAMAAAYSMTPLIICLVLSTILSNILTFEEMAFSSMILNFGIVWFLFLVFVGCLTIHNYTVIKTVWTIILTLLAICVILFIGALIFSLTQQLFAFFSYIYTELSYRR